MVVAGVDKRLLSVGKMRGLQQCSTPHHVFAILALDHRNNLRAALSPASPETVSRDEMVNFKREIIGELARTSSAVLLDPEIGAAQCITADRLPGATGLVVALEATGYTGTPNARSSQLLNGWTVAKARRMGASAVKLLVYYHPDSPTASQIEDLVQMVAAQCLEQDMALFLEPLSYSYQSDRAKLSSSERYRVVLETAHCLTIPGVDVLKVESPIDVTTRPDDLEMAKAFAELTSASSVPWILLSAAVQFELFLRQATIACQSGGSGVAVGRAVWQEAPTLSGSMRDTFLRNIAYSRMEKLMGLCNALARPWTSWYLPPDIGDDWHEQYQ